MIIYSHISVHLPSDSDTQQPNEVNRSKIPNMFHEISFASERTRGNTDDNRPQLSIKW